MADENEVAPYRRRSNETGTVDEYPNLSAYVACDEAWPDLNVLSMLKWQFHRYIDWLTIIRYGVDRGGIAFGPSPKKSTPAPCSWYGERRMKPN